MNNRNQAGSAPLMTRAMRETREEAEMYKYDKVYYFKTQLKCIYMTMYITLKVKQFITSDNT